MAAGASWYLIVLSNHVIAKARNSQQNFPQDQVASLYLIGFRQTSMETGIKVVGSRPSKRDRVSANWAETLQPEA